MADVRIVVLQRGWVMVGEYAEDGVRCRLTRARVVRRWGTSTGLGEICAGPTKETVLDDAGSVDFHTLSVVMTLRCSAAGWEEHLAPAVAPR